MISDSTELLLSSFYWNIRALQLDFYHKGGEKEKILKRITGTNLFESVE